MKKYFLLLLLFSQTSCTNTEPSISNDDSSIEVNSINSNDISVLANKYYNENAVSVVVNDDNLVISSKNLPDHKSAYFAKNHPLYESYEEPNNPSFRLNPNGISEHFFSIDHKASGKYDIAFLGNMSYYPNIQASKYLVKEITHEGKDLLIMRESDILAIL